MSFYIKVSALTDFNCPGCSSFQDYLTQSKIETEIIDEVEYIECSKLISTYSIDNTYLSNNNFKNFIYEGNKTPLCGFERTTTLAMSGKITIPGFLFGGTSLTTILPGTYPMVRTQFCFRRKPSSISYKYKIVRTADALSIYTVNSQGEKVNEYEHTLQRENFPEQIVPFSICLLMQGDGGKGGNFKYEGGYWGGGGGGFLALCINLLYYPELEIRYRDPANSRADECMAVYGKIKDGFEKIAYVDKGADGYNTSSSSNSDRGMSDVIAVNSYVNHLYLSQDNTNFQRLSPMQGGFGQRQAIEAPETPGYAKFTTSNIFPSGSLKVVSYGLSNRFNTAYGYAIGPHRCGTTYQPDRFGGGASVVADGGDGGNTEGSSGSNGSGGGGGSSTGGAGGSGFFAIYY